MGEEEGVRACSPLTSSLSSFGVYPARGGRLVCATLQRGKLQQLNPIPAHSTNTVPSQPTLEHVTT